MQELITAYETKIASMQLVIDTQNQTIASLHSFLVNMSKELGTVVQDNIKKQATLSIQIEELKSKVNNQTVEISDKDATELGITPDSSNDEEDDYGTSDSSNDEEDDYGTSDSSNDEEDDYGTPDSSNDEEDDYGV